MYIYTFNDGGTAEAKLFRPDYIQDEWAFFIGMKSFDSSLTVEQEITIIKR